MEAMNNSPQHKNQVGQPSDNGGHFAATARVEAPEGLLISSATTTPAAGFIAALEAEKAAHDTVLALAPGAFREMILAASPAAVTARFDYTDYYDDGPHLSLASVYDVNGNLIMLKRDAHDAVSKLIDGIDDPDGITEQPAFVAVPSGRNDQFSCRLDLTVEPTSALDAAVAELEAIRINDRAIEARTAALHRQVLTGTAAKAFPGATAVVLKDIAAEGFGSRTDLVAESIEDATGKTLWTRDDSSPLAYELDAAAEEIYRDLESLTRLPEGADGADRWKVSV